MFIYTFIVTAEFPYMVRHLKCLVCRNWKQDDRFSVSLEVNETCFQPQTEKKSGRLIKHDYLSLQIEVFLNLRMVTETS